MPTYGDFSQYGRYAIIKDTQAVGNTTTVYTPAPSGEAAATAAQYPSLVAGQLNDEPDGVTFYVKNDANNTYCGIAYYNGSLYESSISDPGVGKAVEKYPVDKEGRILLGQSNGYFKVVKTQASGGPAVYKITFSNTQ